MSEAKPSPGVPFGRYVLDRRLGTGGFGDVWKARDPALNRWVALKLLRDPDPGDLARFEQEARTAGGLNHPGIVPVYEIGEDAGRRFIAMEFVEGRTLDAANLDPRAAAAAVRDAALAVQAAHERGIVHRDLKPANLMTDRDGRVRVLDFGLARSVAGGSSLTASGMMVGTPAYMSPEQARGEPAGTACDVYGLGATLYALLAGRPPFEGSDVLSLALRVVEEDPVPLRRLRRDLDPDLDAIVLKCLEKEPARRYASASALADDLTRHLAGEAVEATSPSLWRRLRRRIARRRSVAAVAVLAACVAAGTWAVIGWRTSASANRAEKAKRDLVGTMRETSATCLAAALDLRRAGRLDAMEDWSRRAEEACRAVIADQPALAEPHYLVGRMRRAEMRDREALECQDRALALEDGFAPARYERVVLAARVYRSLIERLRLDEERRRVGAGRVVSAPADADAAARARPEAAAYAARILEDLAKLAPADALPVSQRDVVDAIDAWMRRDLPAAQARLHRASSLDPHLEEAIDLAAEIYMAEGLYGQAEVALTQGIQGDRGYVPFRETRALARVRRVLHESAAPDVLDGALEDADEAVLLAPRRAKARFVRGTVRSGRGISLISRHLSGADEFRAAIDEYTAAADLGHPRVEALVERGGARVNLGIDLDEFGKPALETLEEAVRDFDTAIQSDPEWPRAWSFRGNAFVALARLRVKARLDSAAALKEALRSFDESLRLSPRQFDTWLSRASAVVSLGYLCRGAEAEVRYREAIRDCSEAIKLASDDGVAWHRRGLARLNLIHSDGPDPSEEVRAAMADLDEAVRLDKGNADAFQDRGGVQVNYGLWRLNRNLDPTDWFVKGCADFDRALALNPRLPEARQWRFNTRRTLAEAAEDAGADATVWLEGILEDGPHVLKMADTPATHYFIGWAAALLGGARLHDPRASRPLLELAIRHLSAAAKREPGVADIWLHLGASRVNLALSAGDLDAEESGYAQAEADLDRAVRLDAQNRKARLYRGNARLNLAITRKKRGQEFADAARRALEDFEKVLKAAPEWRATVQPKIDRVNALLER